MRNRSMEKSFSYNFSLIFQFSFVLLCSYLLDPLIDSRRPRLVQTTTQDIALISYDLLTLVKSGPVDTRPINQR